MSGRGGVKKGGTWRTLGGGFLMQDLEDRVILDTMDDLGGLQGSYPEGFVSLSLFLADLTGTPATAVEYFGAQLPGAFRFGGGQQKWLRRGGRKRRKSKGILKIQSVGGMFLGSCCEHGHGGRVCDRGDGARDRA